MMMMHTHTHTHTHTHICTVYIYNVRENFEFQFLCLSFCSKTAELELHDVCVKPYYRVLQHDSSVIQTAWFHMMNVMILLIWPRNSEEYSVNNPKD